MKEYQLTLQAQWRPEVLERILRVVRHRGFRLLQLEMNSSETQIELAFKVAGERPIENLVSQLDKLFDVQQIDVQQ
jgi:acetolactate synthase II small subunit